MYKHLKLLALLVRIIIWLILRFLQKYVLNKTRYKKLFRLPTLNETCFQYMITEESYHYVKFFFVTTNVKTEGYMLCETCFKKFKQ